MRIVNGYPRISESEILDEFSKYDLSVSKEYISFITEHNGGYPDTELEYVDKEDDEYRISIHCFYGISDVDTRISLFARRGFLKNSLPSPLLSIAEDGIGNEICLGVEGEYFGKIYFWNKDGETPGYEEPTFDNVELITDSLATFLSSLEQVE
ncbi:MAG: SMI1/KNR4 family protein [Kangiellaceae bacterium]|nr:SMI1/KNR4 family protein [Kangiellaceae bacterium]